jgi:NADPH2 dehydrogenase
MTPISIARLGSIKSAEHFQEHLRSLQVNIPCDKELQSGSESPLRQPLVRGGIRIDNRIAVQPMEGWDCALDGNPTDNTIRRWQRFGRSGAKLIWGGEAAAVAHDGRANPNQLLVASHTEKGLDQLRRVLIEEHRRTAGSDDGLLIGLQLTHSGRYSRPNVGGRGEPRILYRHPILDRRLNLPSDYPVLTDGEVGSIIENFHRAAATAWKLGFDFVDVKHCHGYLGHEFLSARTREGAYGGSFEGRSRFLREVVHGINSAAPKLHVAVRLSAFDTIPFRPDKAQSSNGKLGPGIPETDEAVIPYRSGFGVDALHPTETDLTETVQFLSLLEELGIRLVNITGGSPYYNPHIQRPALYPPSDGYQPPEDPLLGVARQMDVTRRLKDTFPNLIFVGSAYSYLQDFLPYVAQAAVRDGWTDFVGLGRMVLSYPEILWDASEGKPLQRKLVCRTFSDCTTAPRNGLVSGCYPLDKHYKDSQAAVRLKAVKQAHVNPTTD